jgi:ferrous iron transport protein B
MATILIWFLQNFDVHFGMTSDSSSSILAVIAGAVAPVFAPMHFGDWRISTALMTGFIAKESVVSTLTILFGTTAALEGVLSVRSALAMLVFCLLYTPCVAAIASIRRELGTRWALSIVIGQCVIAWICAFIVYVIGGIFLL